MFEIEWLQIDVRDEANILLAAAMGVLSNEQGDDGIIEPISTMIEDLKYAIEVGGFCKIAMIGRRPVSLVVYQESELAVWTLHGEDAADIDEVALLHSLALIEVPRLSIYPISDDQRICLYRMGFKDGDTVLGELILER
jgi:hypothetical protein